jgi:hypothetical protein
MVTFLTRPTPIEVRRNFLERVRPPAIFWGELGSGAVARKELGRVITRWSLVVAANLCCLLAPCYLLFGQRLFGGIMLGAGIALFVVMVRVLRRDPLLT